MCVFHTILPPQQGFYTDSTPSEPSETLKRFCKSLWIKPSAKCYKRKWFTNQIKLFDFNNNQIITIPPISLFETYITLALHET